MRAGAREFLNDPVLPTAVADALVRASVRRDEVRRVRKPVGKLFVFAGAKGGSGTTTLAGNFAVSLAKESGATVALLDLDLQLGDAALSLGVSSKFSTADALENTSRLDSDFLSAMLTKHVSGVAVLPAPDAVSHVHLVRSSVDKLLRIAREDFNYVVVDAGSSSADVSETLFGAATTVYLVAQVALPELRNANRFITRYFTGANESKLEIVLNRYAARGAEIDDAAISKALNRPARWKVPNDYPAARGAQDTGIPIVMGDSSLARCIRDMSRTASGQAAVQEKKKRFGLFR
jgi:pilus assembly protein CpaE